MAPGAGDPDGLAGLRPNKIALIDGSYLLHRALRMHGGLSANADGLVLGGTFLCLRSLLSIAKNTTPLRIFWTHDKGADPFRQQLYPEYKKKEMTEEELAEEERYREAYREQQAVLLNALPSFGVHVFVGPYEADDTIANLCRLAGQVGWGTVICSDDHDFVQLVSPGTSLYSPHHAREFTSENIGEFSSWLPHETVLAKAILGDKSDNIPSPCKGLGKVGLRKLFDKMQTTTIQEAASASEGMGKKYDSLRDPEVRRLITRNVQLIALNFIPPANEAELIQECNVCRPFDMFVALATVQRLGFGSFVESFGSWCRYFEGVY